MNDQQFEEMVRKIESEVHAEAREALGDKGFERWRNPKFCGAMADADSSARLTGGCGDTMSMFVKIKDGRIERAQYTTDGCGSSAVAGSFAAELATGRSLDEGKTSDTSASSRIYGDSIWILRIQIQRGMNCPLLSSTSTCSETI